MCALGTESTGKQAFASFAYLCFLRLHTFDLHFHFFIYLSCKALFLQYIWKCVNMKNMCVIMLVSPLIWRSNMVNKDRQQDPLSLPFTRPEQKLRHWLLITSWYNVDYISKVPYL